MNDTPAKASVRPTPAMVVFAIGSATIVRVFLENFSNPEPAGGFTMFLLILNYFLFYGAVAISLGIVVGLVSKQPLMKTVAMASFGLPVIWIAPIVDMIFGGGCMAYIGTTGATLLRDFATFFGPMVTCGATIGIKLEIAIILALLARYAFKKTNSVPRALLAGIGSYAVIFFHAAIPGIIKTIAGSATPDYFMRMFDGSLLGTTHTFSGASGTLRYMEQIAIFMGRVPWLMIVAMVGYVAWRSRRDVFSAWVKNARGTRVMYYLAMALAGAIMAVRTSGIPVPAALPDLLAYAILALSIAISCWLGVVVNDLSDAPLDAVNAPDRPLVTGALTESDMRQSGIVFAVLALSGGLLINWNVFMMIVMWQTVYAVYSTKLFRMKRHFLSSSFLVGLAGLSALLAGYFLIAPDQSFRSAPLGIVFAAFVTFAITSNTKDFKDVKGDRVEGIKTMPVVFGTRRAGLILTLVLIGWILLAGIAFHSWLVAAMALPWFVMDLVVRRRVPEKYRFYLIVAQMIVVALFA